MVHLTENRNEEGIETLNNALNQADLMPHPFLSAVLSSSVREIVTRLTGTRPQPAPSGRPVPDSDVPIETQKRREAEAAGKPFRVPEWWRGEEANYKVAQVMMKTLPKDIGPLKK